MTEGQGEGGDNTGAVRGTTVFVCLFVCLFVVLLLSYYTLFQKRQPMF